MNNKYIYTMPIHRIDVENGFENTNNTVAPQKYFKAK